MGNTVDPTELQRTAVPQEGADLSGESTVALLERVRRGEERAVEHLLARHLPALQRWARGRLPAWARGITDTDDLVQDTMLQTFKRLDTFEPRHVGALQAYLRQTVLNRIRDELRRTSRRGTTVNLDDVDVHAAGSPLEQAIGRQALERYERALAMSTTEDRELLIARLELGYSYEEVAALLGKPSADAARKAAQRALVRLVALMKALPSS